MTYRYGTGDGCVGGTAFTYDGHHRVKTATDARSGTVTTTMLAAWTSSASLSCGYGG